MAISAIKNIANTQYFSPLSQISALRCVEKFFIGLNILSYASTALHVVAPRFSPFLWLRGCQEHDKAKFSPEQLSTIEKVQAKIEHYRKAMGIDSPVSLMINKGSFLGIAQGLSGIPGVSTPVIASGIEEIESAPEDQIDGVLCHELAHVKNLDVLKTGAWAVAVITVSSVAFPLFMGLSSVACVAAEIGFGVGAIGSLSLLSRSFEKQADLDAAKTLCATLGTTKPLIDFFKDLEQDHGSSCLDIMHPPLKERIRYLEEFELARN